MTDNEKELITIIRTSDNPNALEIALELLLTFLERESASEAPNTSSAQSQAIA